MLLSSYAFDLYKKAPIYKLHFAILHFCEFNVLCVIVVFFVNVENLDLHSYLWVMVRGWWRIRVYSGCPSTRDPTYLRHMDNWTLNPPSCPFIWKLSCWLSVLWVFSLAGESWVRKSICAKSMCGSLWKLIQNTFYWYNNKIICVLFLFLQKRCKTVCKPSTHCNCAHNLGKS